MTTVVSEEQPEVTRTRPSMHRDASDTIENTVASTREEPIEAQPLKEWTKPYPVCTTENLNQEARLMDLLSEDQNPQPILDRQKQLLQDTTVLTEDKQLTSNICIREPSKSETKSLELSQMADLCKDEMIQSSKVQESQATYSMENQDPVSGGKIPLAEDVPVTFEQSVEIISKNESQMNPSLGLTTGITAEARKLTQFHEEQEFRTKFCLKSQASQQDRNNSSQEQDLLDNIEAISSICDSELSRKRVSSVLDTAEVYADETKPISRSILDQGSQANVSSNSRDSHPDANGFLVRDTPVEFTDNINFRENETFSTCDLQVSLEQVIMPASTDEVKPMRQFNKDQDLKAEHLVKNRDRHSGKKNTFPRDEPVTSAKHADISCTSLQTKVPQEQVEPIAEVKGADLRGEELHKRHISKGQSIQAKPAKRKALRSGINKLVTQEVSASSAENEEAISTAFHLEVSEEQVKTTGEATAEDFSFQAQHNSHISRAQEHEVVSQALQPKRKKTAQETSLTSEETVETVSNSYISLPESDIENFNEEMRPTNGISKEKATYMTGSQDLQPERKIIQARGVPATVNVETVYCDWTFEDLSTGTVSRKCHEKSSQEQAKLSSSTTGYLTEDTGPSSQMAKDSDFPVKHFEQNLESQPSKKQPLSQDVPKTLKSNMAKISTTCQPTLSQERVKSGEMNSSGYFSEDTALVSHFSNAQSFPAEWLVKNVDPKTDKSVLVEESVQINSSTCTEATQDYPQTGLPTMESPRLSGVTTKEPMQSMEEKHSTEIISTDQKETSIMQYLQRTINCHASGDDSGTRIKEDFSHLKTDGEYQDRFIKCSVSTDGIHEEKDLRKLHESTQDHSQVQATPMVCKATKGVDLVLQAAKVEAPDEQVGEELDVDTTNTPIIGPTETMKKLSADKPGISDISQLNRKFTAFPEDRIPSVSSETRCLVLDAAPQTIKTQKTDANEKVIIEAKKTTSHSESEGIKTAALSNFTDLTFEAGTKKKKIISVTTGNRVLTFSQMPVTDKVQWEQADFLETEFVSDVVSPFNVDTIPEVKEKEGNRPGFKGNVQCKVEVSHPHSLSTETANPRLSIDVPSEMSSKAQQSSISKDGILLTSVVAGHSDATDEGNFLVKSPLPLSDDVSACGYQTVTSRGRNLLRRKHNHENVSSPAAQPGDIYAAILDYRPLESETEGISVKEGQEVEILDASKPHKWRIRTIDTNLEGLVPSCYLEKPTDNSKPKLEPRTDPKEREAIARREAVVKELVETEEDFSRDMQYVVKNYMKEMDNPNMPKELRDQKDVVFSNFKEISDFHNNVLIKGVQYHASQPAKLGITFLRLERDFDMHVKYCKDELQSQAILKSGPLKEYFDEFSRKIGDDKTLPEHLKLPIQRINDYQLLLKELVKYSARLKEDVSDLQRALDFMQALPQRTADLKYINSVQGFRGSLQKLGRLLKHDLFEITDSKDVTREGYVFLFKGRVFITEVKRISGDKMSYMLKKIVKLPDVEVVEEIDGDEKVLQFRATKPDQFGFPLTLRASTVEQKEAWSKELQVSRMPTGLDLGEDEPEVVPPSEEPVQEPEAKKAKKDVEEENILSDSEMKAEPIEEGEDMNTAITESMRSESVTSLDAGEVEAGKPRFTLPLRGVTCSLGDTTVLECQILSNPPATVTWLKNNKPLPKSSRVEPTCKGTKHSLVLKDTIADDGGLYTVVASNLHGSSSCSSILNLRSALEVPKDNSRPTSPGGTILPHAPVFRVKLKDTELLEGTSVRFELVVRGHPEPTVTFLKDGKALKQDERVRVIFESKEVFELVIDHVLPNDAGTYLCVATNSEGKDETSGTITITKSKVLFQGLEEDDTVGWQTPSPRPRTPLFKWFKDGKEFEASERFQVAFCEEEDTLALVFQHVTPDDAGLYTCVASTSGGKISCSAELTVQGAVHHLLKDPEPPSIKAQLSDVEVGEGGSAMLELKATGYPMPKINWYKGKKEVQAEERIRFLFEDDESHTLVIKDVRKDDAGTYKAVAKNDLGQADTSCKLTVTCPPTFKKALKDMAVLTDETIRMEVGIEGTPAPDVKWYKDGKQVNEDGDRMKITDEADGVFVLTIKKAKLNDSGSYSCVATNSCGSQSAFGAVVVNAPPSFLQEMKSIDAAEDETVSFSVKIAGSPKPTVEWLKDGASVILDNNMQVTEDGATYTLVINQVKQNDAGKYACKIKNEFGSVSSTGKLGVKVPPAFTQELSDVTATEGDFNFDLTVKALGSPSPTIKWFHDGEELTENQDYNIISDDESGTYSLRMKKVKSVHSGEYSCQASNPLGKATTSGKVNVNVPPTFLEGLKDTSTTENQDVAFTVKIAGQPKPSVKWMKDNAELTIDGTHIKTKEEASDTFTLIIHQTSTDDEGKYSCTICNEFGTDTSSGKLVVSGKPQFIRRLSDKRIEEEDISVDFVVQVDGTPKPSVKWFFEDEEITEDRKYKFISEEESGTYTLQIKKASNDLLGKYSCEASNVAGKEKCSAVLSAAEKHKETTEPPAFIKGLRDKETSEGQTADFTVKIAGRPQPTVKWLKDGAELTIDNRRKKQVEEASDTFTLIIEEVTRKDEGQYTCEISNKCGTETSSCQLDVYEKPIFEKGLRDKEVYVEEDVSFEVLVKGHPDPEVTWHKSGERLEETEHMKITSTENAHKLTIVGVSTEDQGTYTCKASNKGGTASVRAELSVKQHDDSEKPLFIKHMVDTVAVLNDAVRFEVKVTGKPAPQISWMKEGMELVSSDCVKIVSDGMDHSLTIRDLTMDDTGEYTCTASNEKGETSESATLTVKEPEIPSVDGMADQEVQREAAVKFRVTTTGFPIPTVEWYKDGNRVFGTEDIVITADDEKQEYSLAIRKVIEDHVAVYACEAINSAGKARGEGRLSLKVEPPEFVKDLIDMDVKLGDTIRFEARLRGYPSPKVTWLKDSKELKESNHIKIVQKGEIFKLEILGVVAEDITKYTCRAVNEAGEAQSSGALNLEEVAPTLQQGLPGTTAVNEGSQLILEAKVGGTPVPEVKWLKDGTPVKPSGRINMTTLPDGTACLAVNDATPEDSGKYAFIATNPQGSVSSDGDVTVKPSDSKKVPAMQPAMTQGLVPAKFTVGEPAELIAKVSGEPVPEVKWLKDGEEIQPGKHFTITEKPDGTRALLIDKVSPDDSGKYAIVAKNIEGQTKSEAPVTIAEAKEAVKKPSLVEDLKPTKLTEGQSGTLEAKVDGKPVPEVTWLKDEVPIKPSKHIAVIEEPDGTRKLVIDKVNPDDAGKYAIVAKNSEGETKSEAPVTTVEEKLPTKKPEVIERLKPTELVEGHGGKLEAKVDGHPVPEVKWLKDGTVITPSKHFAISKEPDGKQILQIDKVTPDDAGKYCLVASNPTGECKSEAPVTTTSAPQKPGFAQGLLPTMLTEGKPGKLEIKMEGNPMPNFKWLKNGNEITPDDHLTTLESPDGTVALLFDKVTPQDAGQYAVVLTNKAGEAKSEAKVITIPPEEAVSPQELDSSAKPETATIPPVEVEKGKKPEFIKGLENIEIFEGKPLKLDAKITADPKASIKWLKDGEELQPSDHIAMLEEPDGSVALMIKAACLDDAGKYTIIATNDVGKTRSSGLVEVRSMPKEKPEIIDGLKPATFTEGQPGKLQARVASQTKPIVKWMKDGEEVTPSNRIHTREDPDGTVILEIDNVKPEEAGQYSLAVANDSGESRTSAPVTVNQPPIFIKPIQSVEGVEGCPIKLEGQLSGVPRPDVTWLKDGKQIIPDGEHIKAISLPDGTITLFIAKCRPEDAGSYQCIAKNPFGEASSDGLMSVSGKQQEGEPHSAPTVLSPLSDVLVKEGDPLKLETTVMGNPVPDVQWFLDDQPIFPSDNIHPTFDGKKASLDIKRTNPQHSGQYECKARNPLGEANSKCRANVKEQSAPKFIQRLSDFSALPLEPLKMTCRVKGDPEPDIEWYFNGNLIGPGLKYHMSKEGDLCTLTLPKPRPKDAGRYECRAKNPVGEDRCSAEVQISEKEAGEPPMFLKKIGDTEVKEGATAKFTACVTGIPTPEIKWFRNGEQIDVGPRHKMELEPNGILRLMVYNVEPGDVGEYRVSIFNPYGSDSCTGSLRLESLDDKYRRPPLGDQYPGFDKFRKTGAPVPLADKPRILRMTDRDLTLGWKPSIPAGPRVPVTYTVEMSKHPDGDWSPYRSGIKDSLCDVRGLTPGQDYRFRIRVENKHGVSDPSPYVTAHRSKLEPPTPGEYKPKDYELEHPPLEKMAEAPRFLRKEEDTMYGVRGRPVNIEFWVYGYPQPTVTWFFNGTKLEMGGKYDSLQDRNGQVVLYITRMTEADEGNFLCHAVNEHGEAQMKMKLLLADPPMFTKRLSETTIMLRRGGHMECRVVGIPYPKIKWYKDWLPIYDSSRIKILWEEPDKCSLHLTGSILKDSGLYSCVASNIAGTASCSAMLTIEESEDQYDILTYSRPRVVKPHTKPFEEHYDIGDELGRGTQGIIYHAVERGTGKSFAAKAMHGKGRLRDFMTAEVDAMNQLCHPRLVRLWDTFDNKSSLTLLTDLCGGGELLDNILQRGTLTESDVAHYIKQVLEGLEHMHGKLMGHLGLTIGDLLVSRVHGDQIKIGDFGLATRLYSGRDFIQEYGHPEFVAPELANKKPASLASDMWSVGVIAYLLLSGNSPFLGENDRETLKRVQEGKYDFLHDSFAEVSDAARDFISKLMVYDPSDRLDVKAALEHPWLKCADIPSKGDELNNIDRLRDYYKKWKDWHANASCKRFYRRRPMESCFTHPSRMIYPPGEVYTPPSSPEPEQTRSPVKPAAFDDVTFQQRIQREPIDARSESQYQSGPDTYLLQYRDVDFPMRVRQYLRVGAARSPSLASNLRDQHWGGVNVAVRERRRFLDVMDEETDDEKKGLGTRMMPMRLQHEVGSLGYAHSQLESLKQEAWKDKGTPRSTEIGAPPFFREKISEVVIREDENAVFKCYAEGNPPPSYMWFRNDGILIETSRIVVKRLDNGHCELHLKPGKAYDAGVFKCVARNTHGAAVCRARLKIGGVSGMPESPEIVQSSDTEVHLKWAPPSVDGNSPTLCYSLEYKTPDDTVWTKVSCNIEQDCFVVRNLSPLTTYHFRISARNKFGWGEFSFPSDDATTLPEGSPKVRISKAMKYKQDLAERGHEVNLIDDEPTEIDYSIETNPIPEKEGELMDLYRFVAEVSRGRMSVVLKTWVKELNETLLAKAIYTPPINEISAKREYDILKTLRHERIITLHSASFHPNLTVLIMEKLPGIDVLTYLTSKSQYKEETVVYIIHQVLDALNYLHYRNICYLELQPDNVVMINTKRPDIKLADFGSAQFVPKSGGVVNVKGSPEYLAPEIIKNEEVNSAADIWCVGVLTYILLSGFSPFQGADEEETANNVTYVRYRFDHLYRDVTQEATRFLMQIFKRTPHKRPTIEECEESKWLLPNEFLIKKRENAVFVSHPLKKFAEAFHAKKQAQTPKELLGLFGVSFTRSVSLEEDTYEEF